MTLLDDVSMFTRGMPNEPPQSQLPNDIPTSYDVILTLNPLRHYYFSPIHLHLHFTHPNMHFIHYFAYCLSPRY